MSAPNGIRVILGTMTFGQQTSKDVAKVMMQKFQERSGKEIDTARMYVNGETEQLLGELFTEEPRFREFIVASKANAFPTHNKTLSAESIQRQVKESLDALKSDQLDIFYLHAPDANTSLTETLEATQREFKRGAFKELGLSNFSAWEVVDIHHRMRASGYVVPTVYQGMYNCITRDIDELIPALRRLNMRLYIYNPLAGGMLTGKYLSKPVLTEGRFSSETVWGRIYQQRFMQDAHFAAVERIHAAAAAHQLSLTQIAFSWLLHHSHLTAGDGIIIGASGLGHFDQNLNYLLADEASQRLPDDVLAAINEAAALIRSANLVPKYYRGVSLFP